MRAVSGRKGCTALFFIKSMTKKEELNRLFGAYDIRLEKLYDKFIDRLVHLGYNLDELTEDVLFNFDNFPELTEELNKVFNDYVQEQMLCYKAGITDGVALAYNQNKGVLSGFSVLSNKALMNVRNNAADAFIRNRLKSPRGLSLSQLVWNYSQQSKSEFEVAISDVIADGLKSGTSAEELGRRVREYLNHPDMMYRRYHEKVIVNGQKKDVVTWRRRVIDENGKVRFVKAPLEEVGMGHYRSSRKNAVRLMRTEINSSYHFANYEFWQNEPYIIGIRISLSPQHPHEDICDDLAGDYPKDFKWSGWHPQCLCTSDPITIKGKEKEEFYRRLSEGEDMSGYVSPNRVKDVPKRYRAYTKEHHDEIFRAAKRGKLAWHYLDNTKYWANQFTPAELKQMGIAQVKTQSKPIPKVVKPKVDFEKITVPEVEILKDSTKIPFIERSERMVQNLALLLGKNDPKVQYLEKVAKLGDSESRFKIVRKKYKELLSDGQYRIEAIARLNKLRRTDLSSIPDIWKDRFNQLVKDINEYDYTKGYNGIVNKIEHAHNIYKLSTNGKVKSIGFDNISDKTPYQIFEDFESKIAGFSKSVPKKEFFDKFDEFVPLYLQKAKGAYYHPSFNHVVMSVHDDYIDRMTKAVWYRDGLFYHEYGHAYDYLKKLRNSKEFEPIFQEFASEANKDKGAALELSVKQIMQKERARLSKDLEYISYRSEAMEAYRNKDYAKADLLEDKADERLHALIYDMEEQVGAFTDCLQAALKGHRGISPRGHSSSYFSSKDLQLAEFYAHASENFWRENPYFEEIAPELYKAMREFIKGH